MSALTSYILSHSEERQDAQARNKLLYTQQGTGVRDLDARTQLHQRTSIEGFLHRQACPTLIHGYYFCHDLMVLPGAFDQVPGLLFT